MTASGILIAIAITLGEIVAKAIDALIDALVQFLVLRRRVAAAGANPAYASDQNERNERVEPPSHALISSGRSQRRAEKLSFRPVVVRRSRRGTWHEIGIDEKGRRKPGCSGLALIQ